jgi:hypothetical protein
MVADATRLRFLELCAALPVQFIEPVRVTLRNWDETIESTEKNQDNGKNAIKESRHRYFKSGDVGILRR